MCTDAEIETVEEICQKFRDAGFPDLADHIAEAWKRERSDAMKTAMMAKCEVCSEQPLGNAAAMRKALVGLSQAVQDFMATKGSNFYPDMAVALEAAAAALSAPPRNCDLFSIYSEAEAYWHENVECAEVNGCFDVWLFEPAAEQKGADNEQK